MNNYFREKDIYLSLVIYTQKLITMAKEICINDFSDNIIYLERHIDVGKSYPRKDLRSYIKSKRYSVDYMAKIIFERQKYLSWVDLHLLSSEKDNTFVLITMIFDYEKNIDVKEKFNFHATFPVPFTIEEIEKKIDINLQKHFG